MNRILFLSLLFISLFTTKAKCDRFVFNGDTSYIDSKSPLEQYPKIAALQLKLVGFGASCFDCNCFKYEAEWSIINNQLYLTNIYSCPENNKHLKADINSLFDVHDGKVKAVWVTDSLWVPKGKPFAFFDIMIALYKTETLISIINGKIVLINEFNYPDSEESIYAKNESALRNFIYSNINWNKIPDLTGGLKRVFISTLTGTSGKPENIKIVRGTDEAIYNEEAVRVVSMLPWSIFYRHGKVFKENFSFVILFSEENREKYAH